MSNILEIKNVSHTYGLGTPFAKEALSQVNLNIEEGDFVGLVGHTGSGKSTLVQCLNGLIIPTEGDVVVEGVSLKESKNLKEIRKRVGMVFQYPEYQLFEETVARDIAFGPKNLGLSKEEVEARVDFAMDLVQLNRDLKDRSPFELSGGQKRRVAIAGILAMKPKVLILDEPTAGLDPHGRDEILGEIKSLYDQGGLTIIMVSHSMEEVAKLTKRMIVMNHGKVAMDGTPRELFRQGDKLKDLSLTTPQVTKVMEELKKRGADVSTDAITIDEAYEELVRYLEGGHHA